MDYLTQRFDKVAEGILEYESLTADLDDEAAQLLLDWGLASAKMIVDGTAGIEDDEEADEVMYARLRANRGLMLSLNKWAAKREGMNEQASLKEFSKVSNYAATVYGQDFTPPDENQRQTFISSYQADNDVQMILNLRRLFEEFGAPFLDDEGVEDAPASDESADNTLSDDSSDEGPSDQLTDEGPTSDLPVNEMSGCDDSVQNLPTSDDSAQQSPTGDKAVQDTPTH